MGEFTIKSATNQLISPSCPTDAIWKRVWSWSGPQRVRTFLWLCIRDALFTNEKRKLRHMAEDDVCPRCGLERETTIHVLRDCVHTKGLWIGLLNSQRVSEFFSYDLVNWFRVNLVQDFGQITGREWNVLFGVTCWLTWRWRNACVFKEEPPLPNQPMSLILKYMDDIEGAQRVQMKITPGAAVQYGLIGWISPPMDWIAVNTDGGVRQLDGIASCGGLIRDSNGRWIQGFSCLLGICSVLQAELWGAYHGLKLAWQLGYRRVLLEIDSLLAVNMLNSTCDTQKQPNTEPLLELVKNMLRRSWSLKIVHIYREANQCADRLATKALELQLGYHQLQQPPRELFPLLFSDQVGVGWNRGNIG